MANKKNPASMKAVKAKPKPKQTKEELLKDFKEVMKPLIKGKKEALKECGRYNEVLMKAYAFFNAKDIQEVHQYVINALAHVRELYEDIEKKIDKLTVKQAQETTDLIYGTVPQLNESLSVDAIFYNYICESFIAPLNDSYFQLLNHLYTAKDE